VCQNATVAQNHIILWYILLRFLKIKLLDSDTYMAAHSILWKLLNNATIATSMPNKDSIQILQKRPLKQILYATRLNNDIP